MSIRSFREKIRALLSQSRQLDELKRLEEGIAKRLEDCFKISEGIAEDLRKQKAASIPVIKEHTFYGQFSPPVDQFIFRRYFSNLGIQGVFVECGAFDGLIECSCKFFEETMGWTAYNIEAMPAAFSRLQINRPKSNNFNLALSNKSGVASFKEVKHPELGLNFGNSSLGHTSNHLQSLAESGCTFSDIEVRVITWKAFIEQQKLRHVDLLVLDVEGHELSVIEGMQGCAVLPDLICIEIGHLDFNTIRQGLAELGYVYDISSHVNAFFIHETKVSLFAFRAAAKSTQCLTKDQFPIATEIG